jgi:hypothetical protein
MVTMGWICTDMDMGEKRNAYKILLEKLFGNNKMAIIIWILWKQIKCEMAQDHFQWQASILVVLNM